MRDTEQSYRGNINTIQCSCHVDHTWHRYDKENRTDDVYMNVQVTFIVIKIIAPDNCMVRTSSDDSIATGPHVTLLHIPGTWSCILPQCLVDVAGASHSTSGLPGCLTTP